MAMETITEETIKDKHPPMMAAAGSKPKGGRMKLVVLAVVVVAFLLAVKFFPVAQWLKDGAEWTRGLGAWGPVAVGLIYVVACVFFLPGSVLTLVTGAIYGVMAGTAIVSIGATTGACVAFLVGRFLVRGWIATKVTQNAKFGAIDEAMGLQGFKIVFLTRLSPVFPFNLLNYAYGLTKVSFWKYALASWVGMLPGIIMYVYIGSAAARAAINQTGTDGVATETGKKILFYVGLAATVIVVVFVTRIARKVRKEAVPRRQDNGSH